MGVSNLQCLEDRRHASIFAPFAMERVEGNIGLEIGEHSRNIMLHINRGYLKAGLAQRICAGFTTAEADLALGRPATEQNGHMRFPGISMRHDASPASVGNPIRLISHSSSTPEFSRTRLRIVSPSSSICEAVASPSLIRKLQCKSDTFAGPIANPRKPAASISCHDFMPG